MQEAGYDTSVATSFAVKYRYNDLLNSHITASLVSSPTPVGLRFYSDFFFSEIFIVLYSMSHGVSTFF